MGAEPDKPTDPVDRGGAAARHERLLAMLQKALGHELPTQLIAVQGLARLLELEEGERLGEEGRAYLGRLSAAAEKAHALVAELAEVVRLERSPAPAGGADLAEVAAEAIAEVKQLAADRPVEYHGPGQAPVVSVPRPALRKLLVLLLRRAGTKGTDERPLRVEVNTRLSPTDVEIRVSDDGATLPGAAMERLFEPFAGAGLDLFLVRHLAEGWGGTVRVEARPGGGSVFVVTCPLSV
jgi:two-component system sensor histidine kinase KdpD